MKIIPNVGFATVFNKILHNFVSWDADEVMKVHDNNLRNKMYEVHKIALEKAINLITCAPALNEKYELKPMHPMSTNDKEWGQLIGFNGDPNDTSPVPKDMHHKAKIFEK